MGIITNSMSGAGDKGQGYIDVTSQLPADFTWSNNSLRSFLDSCYDKGYKIITFTFNHTVYSKYKVTFYGTCYPVPESTTSYKGVWFFTFSIVYSSWYSAKKYSGTYNSGDSSDSGFNVYDLSQSSWKLGSSSTLGARLSEAIEIRNISIGETSSSTTTYVNDMFTYEISLPAAISSTSITLDNIDKNIFYTARKIFLKNGSSSKINDKTVSTLAVELYANEMGVTKSYSLSFTDGQIVDSENNIYDVSIKKTDADTNVYTLYVIQRSIKLTDNSTSGTFTDYEISTLQNGTKQIELNNEIYKLSSTGADSITFTSLAGKKHINIVISTKAWTLVEESPNPTCYDTNETIDFTAIMAAYLADTTKSGKIRPFTSSDTLLSADSIKKIIDGNYKMFSFNAKIGENVMKAYMPISYYSEANSSNYYTFKGQVTFLNSGWNTIDVQMQFIHNSTAGTYSNNPGYGFFKFTAETAISA